MTLMNFYILTFFVLSMQDSHGKLIKFQHNQALHQIFHNIVKQQSLTGFTVSTHLRGKSDVRKIASELLQTITRMVTITSINEHSSAQKYKLARFFERDPKTRKRYLIKSGTSPFVISSSPCLPICIVSNDKFDSKNAAFIKSWCQFDKTGVLHKVPKLLYVLFIHHKTNTSYDVFLKSAFSVQKIDVEILSIFVMRSKRAKMQLEYQVHQMNFFLDSYSNLPLQSDVKWFDPGKRKNLHGFQLKMYCQRPTPAYRKHRKNTIDRFNDIEQAIKLMNATYVRVKRSRLQQNYDIKYPTERMNFGKRMTHVQPSTFYVERMMNPVIYDELKHYNIWNFINNILAVTLVTLIIVGWTKLFKFDSETWSVMKIVEMIFTNSNAREPVVGSEVVAFICVIAVGFFFGLDLSTGLTSIMLVRRYERPLSTLDDLRNSNISLVLHFDPKVGMRQGLRREFYQEILDKNVSCIPLRRLIAQYGGVIIFDTLLSNVILHKNKCANLYILDAAGVHVPNRIYIMGELSAKMSDLVEIIYIIVFELDKSSMFQEPLSDIFLRISEVKIFDFSLNGRDLHLNAQSHLPVQIAIEINTNYRLHMEKSGFDKRLGSDGQLHEVWIVLVIGNSFAILVLILETISKFQIKKRLFCLVNRESNRFHNTRLFDKLGQSRMR